MSSRKKRVYFYSSTRAKIHGVLIGNKNIEELLSEEAIKALGLDSNRRETFGLEEVVRFNLDSDDVASRLHQEHFLLLKLEEPEPQS